MVGGRRLPSSRNQSRPVMNAARPVGIGENVLVSVASAAMNSFIPSLTSCSACPPSPAPPEDGVAERVRNLAQTKTLALSVFMIYELISA